MTRLHPAILGKTSALLEQIRAYIARDNPADRAARNEQ